MKVPQVFESSLGIDDSEVYVEVTVVGLMLLEVVRDIFHCRLEFLLVDRVSAVGGGQKVTHPFEPGIVNALQAIPFLPFADVRLPSERWRDPLGLDTSVKGGVGSDSRLPYRW